MAAKKRKKHGGRRKGTPNKVTADVKQAYTLLVQGNIGKMQEWLNQIADGIKVFTPDLDEAGNPALDPKTGEPKGNWDYIVRPDPGQAFKLLNDTAEFVQPKLSRSEHVGENGGAITVEASVAFITPPKRPAT